MKCLPSPRPCRWSQQKAAYGGGKRRRRRKTNQLQCLFLTKLDHDIRRLIDEHLLCPPKGRELHVAVGCYGSNHSPGPSDFRLCAIDPVLCKGSISAFKCSCRHTCWLDQDLLYRTRRNGLSLQIHLTKELMISLGILRSRRQM